MYQDGAQLFRREKTQQERISTYSRFNNELKSSKKEWDIKTKIKTGN